MTMHTRQRTSVSSMAETPSSRYPSDEAWWKRRSPTKQPTKRVCSRLPRSDHFPSPWKPQQATVVRPGGLAHTSYSTDPCSKRRCGHTSRVQARHVLQPRSPACGRCVQLRRYLGVFLGGEHHRLWRDLSRIFAVQRRVQYGSRLQPRLQQPHCTETIQLCVGTPLCSFEVLSDSDQRQHVVRPVYLLHIRVWSRSNCRPGQGFAKHRPWCCD